MPSSTVEDYLKHVYLAEQRRGDALVPMGELARLLKVTPGTVTTMVKTLGRSRLVTYEPRVGVRLTKRGRTIAIQVLRRHRLIELFLVEILGLSWSEVHHEAEVLEHAISERVLERIDEFLGHPEFDPHGDPIPNAAGEIIEQDLTSLAACESGEYEIKRVGDQDPTFLDFAAERGLVPGTLWAIEARDPAADLITVRRGRRRPISVGLSAARKILVQRAPAPKRPPSNRA